jgi:hypothetical protein
LPFSRKNKTKGTFSPFEKKERKRKEEKKNIKERMRETLRNRITPFAGGKRPITTSASITIRF